MYKVFFVGIIVSLLWMGCSQNSTNLQPTSSFPTATTSVIVSSGSPTEIATISSGPPSTPTLTSTPISTLEVVPTELFSTLVPPTETVVSANSSPPTHLEHNGTQMVLIPEGFYRIGVDGELLFNECRVFRSGCRSEWFTASNLIHPVILDAYYIDIYEVTAVSFATFLNTINLDDSSCMGEICVNLTDSNVELEAGIYTPLEGQEQHPVIGVTWYGASAFCAWHGGRLPTEAEWEVAASWDFVEEMQMIYPWGNEFDGTAVNSCDINCEENHAYRSVDDGFAVVAPVGSYENGKSPSGLYDMAGNVWEWTSDWFDQLYYFSAPEENPQGPTEGVEKIVRGGSWFDTGNFTAASIRFPAPPTATDNTIGFRCVMGLQP